MIRFTMFNRSIEMYRGFVIGGFSKLEGTFLLLAFVFWEISGCTSFWFVWDSG